MPHYETPTVPAGEISSGPNTIKAAAANVAGFLGVAEKGPVNEAVLVNSWTQYTRIFGALHEQGWLGHGVYQFFQNGGTKAYINNLMELPDKKKEHGTKQRKKADTAECAKDAEKQVSGKIENPPDIAQLVIGKDEGGTQKTGLFLFDDVPDITLVAAPGLTDINAQNAILAHCEKHRFRFAVLDLPLERANNIDTMPIPRASIFGACYFPWIEILDATSDRKMNAPPSGGICGIFSRIDATRGVHKAPANEIFKTAVGLQYNVSSAEEERLSRRGINCIRAFSAGGIRVCSARTLIPQCAINVRRLSCMIEQSVQEGIRWASRETNTKDLRKQLVKNVETFLRKIWESGALSGNSPEEAFFVRSVNDELHNAESADDGFVVIEYGICPNKAGEFIMFSVSQQTLANEHQKKQN